MVFRLLRGGRLHIQNHSLRRLVARAYGLDLRQVLDGPDWSDRDRFDIEAIFDDGTEEEDSQVRAMLRGTLADRFQLRVRLEERELSYYALVLMNPGGRLHDGIRPSTTDCADYRERRQREGPRTEMPADPHCGVRGNMDSSGLLRVESGAVTMTEFGTLLQSNVDRLVRDETGLGGLFDIDLEYKLDRSTFGFGGAFTASAVGALPLFGALEQQLGLKMEPRQGAMEVLVIEQAQHPSPN